MSSTTTESVPGEAHAVTMTNGLRTIEIIMPGTQRDAWERACRAGETRDGSLAGYVPVDIRPASIVEIAGMRPVDSSYPARSPAWSHL